jgi:hypothetical protein
MAFPAGLARSRKRYRRRAQGVKLKARASCWAVMRAKMAVIFSSSVLVTEDRSATLKISIFERVDSFSVLISGTGRSVGSGSLLCV